MARARTALAVAVSLILSASLFGQTKPAAPGPPSTAPQVIVDSAGNTVGSLIEVVGGLSKAFVRYTLPNGSFTVLAALSGALTGTAAVPLTTSQGPTVYFTSNNCTGDAYLLLAGGVQTGEQLAPYQSLTMWGVLPTQLPAPIPNPSCPTPAGNDGWLYTRASGSCSTATFDPGHPLSFGSYWGSPTPGTTQTGAPLCAVPSAPVVFPNQANPYGGTFSIYSPTQNLSLKYTPPFFVQ